MSPTVLFFSRGRGYGHAIPDMAIADEIAQLDPSVNVRFASYASGAEAFRNANRYVEDLRLPENNPFLETLVKADGLLREVKPTLVVCHEEFAALPAARLYDIPAIFISAWLPQTGDVQAESLRFASKLVVLSEPGIFPVPFGVYGEVHYVGPIIRKMQYTAADRFAIRREMDIGPDAFVVTILPGASAAESGSIFDLVLSAFYATDRGDGWMFWVSRKDHQALGRRAASLQRIKILPYYSPIEKLLAASNVVVTKGTRGATLDAAAVGTPSISLSPGKNSIDDILVPRIGSDISLNAAAVSPKILAGYFQRLTTRPPNKPPIPPSDAARRAAQMIVACAIENTKPAAPSQSPL